MKNTILVTGAAGFIGYHLINNINKKFKNKITIIGIDNINNYYSQKLKLDRVKNLKKKNKNFIFKKIDIRNYKKLSNIFKYYKFNLVVNLAAQAGVRYSLEKPEKYISNNINGFFNILDCSKKFNTKHLVFASSSSVYGDINKYPLKESFATTNPKQLYAATKISNESMAAAYSNLYNMKITGLRYFTVYGPWGRPDMAIFSFVKSLISGQKINVFNQGNHYRDFSYVEDVAEGTQKILFSKKKFYNKNFNVFNIGNNNPIKLLKLVNLIENIIGKKFKKRYLPMQKGDVFKTYSSISKIQKIIQFKPKTNIETGLKKFILWYCKYHKIKI
jgi:UDP-glucuronate 4-epimerase